MARRNFLDADENLMEKNLRFVRNEAEDNFNQFFGAGSSNAGNMAGGVQAPPRDYKVVQPKPDNYKNKYDRVQPYKRISERREQNNTSKERNMYENNRGYLKKSTHSRHVNSRQTRDRSFHGNNAYNKSPDNSYHGEKMSDNSWQRNFTDRSINDVYPDSLRKSPNISRNVGQETNRRNNPNREYSNRAFVEDIPMTRNYNDNFQRHQDVSQNSWEGDRERDAPKFFSRNHNLNAYSRNMNDKNNDEQYEKYSDDNEYNRNVCFDYQHGNSKNSNDSPNNCYGEDENFRMRNNHSRSHVNDFNFNDYSATFVKNSNNYNRNTNIYENRFDEDNGHDRTNDEQNFNNNSDLQRNCGRNDLLPSLLAHFGNENQYSNNFNDKLHLADEHNDDYNGGNRNQYNKRFDYSDKAENFESNRNYSRDDGPPSVLSGRFSNEIQNSNEFNDDTRNHINKQQHLNHLENEISRFNIDNKSSLTDLQSNFDRNNYRQGSLSCYDNDNANARNLYCNNDSSSEFQRNSGGNDDYRPSLLDRFNRHSESNDNFRDQYNYNNSNFNRTPPSQRNFSAGINYNPEDGNEVDNRDTTPPPPPPPFFVNVDDTKNEFNMHIDHSPRDKVRHNYPDKFICNKHNRNDKNFRTSSKSRNRLKSSSKTFPSRPEKQIPSLLSINPGKFKLQNSTYKSSVLDKNISLCTQNTQGKLIIRPKGPIIEPIIPKIEGFPFTVTSKPAHLKIKRFLRIERKAYKRRLNEVNCGGRPKRLRERKKKSNLETTKTTKTINNEQKTPQTTETKDGIKDGKVIKIDNPTQVKDEIPSISTSTVFKKSSISKSTVVEKPSISKSAVVEKPFISPLKKLKLKEDKLHVPEVLDGCKAYAKWLFENPSRKLKINPEIYWRKWWSVYKKYENTIKEITDNMHIRRHLDFSFGSKNDIQNKIATGCQKLINNSFISETNYFERNNLALFKTIFHLTKPGFTKQLSKRQTECIDAALKLFTLPKLTLLYQSFIAYHYILKENMLQAASFHNKEFVSARKMINNYGFKYCVQKSFQELRIITALDWEGFEKEFPFPNNLPTESSQ